MKEEILKLRSEGKSYTEIVKILGCANSTVNYYCGKKLEKSNRWTQEEMDFLRENSNKGVDYCATFLNKTKKSLYTQARKLKIKLKRVLSDEAKNRISERMKIVHGEGRHPGWAHINNDMYRRSYPEKFFLKVFKNNDIFKQFTISEKFSYGKYFIDFLIMELKLIIEIDGCQHYRTEEAIEHDKIRDEYFIQEGFKIYRIKWSDVSKNAKYEIKSLIDFIDNIDNESIRKYSIIECKKEKVLVKCKCGNNYLKNKKSNMCMPCKRMNSRKVKIRPSIEILLKEVKELGYSAVGRKYGVSDNAIRKWIKNGSLV